MRGERLSMGKGFAVLEVDPEFKALIRPLRKDEYLQLEVNLSIDGCRDPIITWNNIIIDGHNRYEICNRLHIPYAVREMPFENRERALFGFAATNTAAEISQRKPDASLWSFQHGIQTFL